MGLEGGEEFEMELSSSADMELIWAVKSTCGHKVQAKMVLLKMGPIKQQKQGSM